MKLEIIWIDRYRNYMISMNLKIFSVKLYIAICFAKTHYNTCPKGWVGWGIYIMPDLSWKKEIHSLLVQNVDVRARTHVQAKSFVTSSTIRVLERNVFNKSICESLCWIQNHTVMLIYTLQKYNLLKAVLIKTTHKQSLLGATAMYSKKDQTAGKTFWLFILIRFYPVKTAI